MKKIVLLILGILVCATMGFAQGVKFETGTWSDMLAKAKAENKFVFVDVYTQWCGPCKHVAKNIFPLKEIGDAYNSDFINYQIDAESEGGKEFVKKYPITGVPTFFFINAEGKVMHKFVGAKDVQGFIQEADMAKMYARHGGIEHILEAINNGTATKEMLNDYYEHANESEKPKALNIYLRGIPVEELVDVNNDLIGEISLYDKDLMIRLIDEIINVGNSEKWAADKRFAGEFNFNIGFPVQYDMSTFLKESIEQGDSAWFYELLDLKERFMDYKRSRFDGDWNIIRGRGLFFATPEYCMLTYMARNRVEEGKFKVELVDYMENLMVKIPVDSVLGRKAKTIELIKKGGVKGTHPIFLQYLETGYMTADNIIDWVDYFWKISPSTKAIKEQCTKYINYAYNGNPYNSKIALKAADLLARIGNLKGAEAVLNTAIQMQKDLKQTDPKVIRPLNLKLRDVQNGKL